MSGIVNAGQASDSRPDDEFYYAVQPNQMTYTDNTGVSRSIHIPRSKFHEACKHMENEDWEALSRYPTWTGAPEQQYSERDFIKMPKQPAGAS